MNREAHSDANVGNICGGCSQFMTSVILDGPITMGDGVRCEGDKECRVLEIHLGSHST